MKKYNISICVISAIIFLITSCDGEDPEPLRDLDGDPSGAVINTSVIDYDDSLLTIELDLYVVNGQGNFARGLSENNFSIEDAYVGYYSELIFENTSIGSSNTNEKGNYSASLLLDQSGSISNTDPFNLRIEAAKIFCGALGGSDYALISSFKSSYADNIVIHTEYSQDTSVLNRELNSLLYRESGGTPLYNAAYSMVGYTNENAPGNNKAIILFTDGNNTTSGVSLEQLTDYAYSENIQIYTVGLSRSVDFAVLSRIAANTDGAFMWAEDARQLITMFGTLGDLLSGNANYYRTTWQVSRSSGTWQSGDSFVTEMTITLSDGSEFVVPFEVQLP
jgi:hypothetical protein